MSRIPGFWSMVACVAICAPGAVVAQAEPGAQPASDVQSQLDELKQAIAVRDQVIRNLIARIEQLEKAGGTAAVAQRPDIPAAAPAESPTPAVDDQQLIRAAFERTLINRGGLLLPAWKYELEPSFNYSHSSSETLVIDGFTIFPVLIVGDIFSERRRRNTGTAALTARLGLPWKSQLELRMPWMYEDVSRLTGDGTEIKVSDHGPGDLELAWSRDLPRLFGRGPQLLGSLRWKMVTAKDPFGLDPDEEIPFGSGFQTLSASLTGVSVLDPVVFFGSLSYTKPLAADKGEFHIEPGSSFGLQLGMAIALNIDTSMNFSFDQSFNARTRVDGIELPGTYVNTGSLSIGLTRAFPSGRTFDTSLVVGLSEDSPDFQLAFAMPVRAIQR